MMFKNIFLCGLIAAVAGVSGVKQPVPKLDGRIIGGRDAKIEEFPHQVSVRINDIHACGGSIISPDYVITASHCTALPGINASIYTVRAGSTHASGGQYLQVEDIINHPMYVSVKKGYDISILKLKGRLRFNNAVRAIDLPELNEVIDDGTNVTCSGWGLTARGGEYSDTLRAVDLKIINRAVCQKAYGPKNDINERMLCAGVGGGKDACKGDSGGPLIVGNKLIGVVSYGRGCARPKYPGIYTNVASFRDFIKEKTEI